MSKQVNAKKIVVATIEFISFYKDNILKAVLGRLTPIVL